MMEYIQDYGYDEQSRLLMKSIINNTGTLDDIVKLIQDCPDINKHDNNMSTPLSQIFHVYSRLGFGISYAEAKVLSQKSLTDIVTNIIVSSSVPTYLTDIKKGDIPHKNEAMEEGMNKKEFQKLIREKTEC